MKGVFSTPQTDLFSIVYFRGLQTVLPGAQGLLSSSFAVEEFFRR